MRGRDPVTKTLDWCRMVAVLALMLAAVAVFGIGRAEAASHDDHAAMHHPAAHGQHHAAAPEQPSQDHGKGGVHHDGGCHCMSATCVPVLPVTLSDLRVHMPRARHAVPAPSTALALAGVDPPAEPPRA